MFSAGQILQLLLNFLRTFHFRHYKSEAASKNGCHLNPQTFSYLNSSAPLRRYKENRRQQMAGSGGSLSFSPSTLIKLDAPCYVCRIRELWKRAKHPKSDCNWPSILVPSSQQIKPGEVNMFVFKAHWEETIRWHCSLSKVRLEIPHNGR